jgi:Methyltransferase FkbM domain
MNRKDFLTGAAGIALGAPLGAVGTLKVLEPEPPPERCPPHGRISHAQAGEDMITAYFFDHFRITKITYLDIGAWDPILINNTYHFYERGFSGVLVEPNVDLSEKLRRVRPRDTTLVAGIGFGAKREAVDYYVMSNPSWSTFDKAEAEHQVKATGGKVTIREVRKMPLLNVNDVMAEHFKGAAPSFVSIDAEGLHLAILKSIDFERFRPPVICVETLVSAESRTIPEIPAFMTTKGYVARGGSFVNTIFVDAKLL